MSQTAAAPCAPQSESTPGQNREEGDRLETVTCDQPELLQEQDSEADHTKPVHINSNVSQTAAALRAPQSESTPGQNREEGDRLETVTCDQPELLPEQDSEADHTKPVHSYSNVSQTAAALRAPQSEFTLDQNRGKSDELKVGGQLSLGDDPVNGGRELNESSQGQDSTPFKTTTAISTPRPGPMLGRSFTAAGTNFQRGCVTGLQKPVAGLQSHRIHQLDMYRKTLLEASPEEWPGTPGSITRSGTVRTRGVKTAVKQPIFINELRSPFQGITDIEVCFDRSDTGLQDDQDTSSVPGCAGGSGSGVSETDRYHYNVVRKEMQKVPRGVFQDPSSMWAAVRQDPAIRAAFTLCADESFVAAKLGTRKYINGTIDAASIRVVTLLLQAATSEMIRDAQASLSDEEMSAAITATCSSPGSGVLDQVEEVQIIHEVPGGSACIINRLGSCLRHCSTEIKDWQSSEGVEAIVRALKAGHEVVTTGLSCEEGRVVLIIERWFRVNRTLHAGMSEREQRIVVQASDTLHRPIGTCGFVFNLFSGVLHGTAAEEPDEDLTKCFTCAEEKVHGK